VGNTDLQMQKGGVNMNEVSLEKGKKRIFCRYIRKNGKVYFPKKARFFTFLVNAK
jgi:hypothetical protein